MLGLFELATTFLLTWPALVVLLVIGILFEHNDHRGWAISAVLSEAAISYFYFHVAFIPLLMYAGGYIVIGLIWSFYRYRRYVIEQVKQINNISPGSYGYSHKKDMIEEFHPTKMLSTITAWIIVWPFSFIDNFVSDLIDGIQTLVKKVFHGIYVRIYESAIANVKIDPPNEQKGD